MTEMRADVDYKEMSDMFREMKDVKDLEVILNFENSTVIRGKTPEGIEDQCLSLCQQYLAGNWLTQTKDTVKVTRILGGYVNQIYYIKIIEPKEEESVPQEVTIKLNHELPAGLGNKVLKDRIIAIAFSDKGLGPKVYGVFDKGVVQSYCKHRNFHKKEHDNPAIVEKVFRTLAHVHAMDVPIDKVPDSQFPYGITEILLKIGRQLHDLEKEFDEYNCTELKNLDFDAEIKWFKDRINEIQSPVVFTHNDYRSSNLMITEPNDDLVICDFDCSCYGYRGSDFCKVYQEYGLGFVQECLQQVNDLTVKDEVFGSLIALYVDECTKIHGKAFTDDPNNSVEHILKEIKFFWAFHTLGYIFMYLSSNPNDTKNIFNIKREFAMELATRQAKNYLAIKQLLIDNKIVSP